MKYRREALQTDEKWVHLAACIICVAHEIVPQSRGMETRYASENNYIALVNLKMCTLTHYYQHGSSLFNFNFIR